MRKCKVFIVKKFMSSKLLKISYDIEVKFMDFEETCPKIWGENYVLARL